MGRLTLPSAKAGGKSKAMIRTNRSVPPTSWSQPQRLSVSVTGNPPSLRSMRNTLGRKWWEIRATAAHSHCKMMPLALAIVMPIVHAVGNREGTITI